MTKKNRNYLRKISILLVLVFLVMGNAPISAALKLYSDSGVGDVVYIANKSIPLESAKVVNAGYGFPAVFLIIICGIAFISALLMRKTRIEDILEK